MAFSIKVPLGKGKPPSANSNLAKDIADEISKKIKGIFPNLGKKETGKGSLAGIGKAAALISLAIAGLSDFLKPIFSLFKVLMTILLLPLIPILKPVVQGLGKLAKGLIPAMLSLKDSVEGILTERLEKLIGTIVDAVVNNVDSFVKIIVLILDILDKFAGPLADILIDGIVRILEFFAVHGETLLVIILDMLEWAGQFLLTNWAVIKEALEWIDEWLKPIWELIKGVLEDAYDILVDKWGSISEALSSFLNGIQSVIDWVKNLIPGGKSGGDSSSSSIPDQSGYTFQDFVSRPGKAPFSISPQDTIIGTKNPEALLGGGGSTVNINNPVVRDDKDIQAIANKVSQVLQRKMKGRFSYG